jgi:hypothetical protein
MKDIKITTRALLVMDRKKACRMEGSFGVNTRTIRSCYTLVKKMWRVGGGVFADFVTNPPNSGIRQQEAS